MMDDTAIPSKARDALQGIELKVIIVNRFKVIGLLASECTKRNEHGNDSKQS